MPTSARDMYFVKRADVGIGPYSVPKKANQ